MVEVDDEQCVVLDELDVADNDAVEQAKHQLDDEVEVLDTFDGLMLVQCGDEVDDADIVAAYLEQVNFIEAEVAEVLGVQVVRDIVRFDVVVDELVVLELVA